MNLNSRYALATVLVCAFLIRLGAAAYWQRSAEREGRQFRLGDSHSYWTLASQIAAGLPYQYGSENARIFRAPLYPMMLAPFAAMENINSGVWWARVMGCVWGTVAVALLACLAHRLGGPKSALFAAAMAAIYPSAIGMSIGILSEAIALPAIMGHLLLWQSAWRAERLPRVMLLACMTGGVAGLAVLARPSWLLFAPFACGIGIVLGGRRPKHVLIFAGSLLGLCLVMSPWWVRNAKLTGHFVLTTLQVGPSLYDGLHAGATGGSDEGMAFSQRFVEEQLRYDAKHPDTVESTLEYRVNKRAQAAATQWSLQNPEHVLILAGRKFLRTWSLWPDGGDISSVPIRLAITLSSFGALLLAIYASWTLFWPITWRVGICWLPCLYFTCLHMVFVGSVRYREPAVFVLLALAGCAVAKQLYGSASVIGPSVTENPIEESVNNSASVSPK